MENIKFSCQVLPQAYTTFGEALPIDENDELRWHMANWGTDMDRYHQLGILANAFGEWQQYLFPWRFIGTANPKEAEWLIFWAKDNMINMPDGSSRRSEFDFKKNPNVLAVQYGSPQLVMIINDDHNYSLDAAGPSSYDLYTVILHELAHGLRLGHTKAPKDIMNESYDRNNKITIDSIEGVQAGQDEKLRRSAVNNPIAKRFIARYVEGLGERESDLKENKGCLSILGL